MAEERMVMKMAYQKPRTNGKVIPLMPGNKKLYRVRIIANPNDSRSIEVVESLLSKCELSRCESSTEDGVSVWSMIVPEDFLDEALDGIAVTVPVDYEFFRDDEGNQFIVTKKEWHRLAGIAEDTATCWEGEDVDDFECEVTQELKALIQAELENLPWPGDGSGDEIFGRIEDLVMAKMDVFTWSEEDIRESVQEAYAEATKSDESTEE